MTFAPSTCRIYGRQFRMALGLGALAPLPTNGRLMRFVFLRPEFCLQLLSHPVSRRQQLLFS